MKDFLQWCHKRGIIQEMLDVIHPDSDNELLDQIKQGNKSAINILIGRWHPKVLNVVRKKLAWNQQSAEDITQDTMLKAFTYLQNGGEVQNFPTWIIQIAKNTAINLTRKKTAIYQDNIPEPTTNNNPTVKNAETKEEIETIRNALDQLEAKGGEVNYADILRRRFFDHETEAEAIERLGIPRGTVKRRIFVAKKELEKILRQNGYGA